MLSYPNMSTSIGKMGSGRTPSPKPSGGSIGPAIGGRTRLGGGNTGTRRGETGAGGGRAGFWMAWRRLRQIVTVGAPWQMARIDLIEALLCVKKVIRQLRVPGHKRNKHGRSYETPERNKVP